MFHIAHSLRDILICSCTRVYRNLSISNYFVLFMIHCVFIFVYWPSNNNNNDNPGVHVRIWLVERKEAIIYCFDGGKFLFLVAIIVLRFRFYFIGFFFFFFQKHTNKLAIVKFSTIKKCGKIYERPIFRWRKI